MRRFFTLILVLCFAASQTVSAQLGIYEFTGSGACPHQNPAVTTQPANAVFSNFSATNVTCNAAADVFEYVDWNLNGTVNPSEYYQFSVTADAGYGLNLTSLTFTHNVSENGSGSGTGNT